MGFFGFGKKEKDQMKTGLEKTRTGFWGSIMNTLTGSVIDDDMYDELEEKLKALEAYANISPLNSMELNGGNIGVISGIVGLIGGLGGFFLPIMFGALVDLTGIRSSSFMLLYGIVWVSLIWMYLTEVRQAPVLGDRKSSSNSH